VNVNLVNPIAISLTSAKLVVEDCGSGTIEFTLYGQPVRLNIANTAYTYDINIAVGDRAILIQNFGALNAGSQGVVKKIIPGYTCDTVDILFDQIFPDQVICEPSQADVNSTVVSIFVRVPLNIVQKL
jgi:hypothetical protein